jgi:hypothetical protein
LDGEMVPLPGVITLPFRNWLVATVAGGSDGPMLASPVGTGAPDLPMVSAPYAPPRGMPVVCCVPCANADCDPIKSAMTLHLNTPLVKAAMEPANSSPDKTQFS